MKIVGLLVLLVAALLLAQIALAKGEAQKVTISGADLAQEISLTSDDAVLNALSFRTLEDYATLSSDAPPSVSGDGYLITRYYRVSLNHYVAFDQLRYYADPAGGRGFLYYVGIVNGSSNEDRHWFRVNPASESMLQSVIATAKREQTVAQMVSLFVKTLLFAGGR